VRLTTPSTPEPLISVWFKSSFPPGRRPVQLIEVPVPVSALSKHSGRISLFLESSPNLDLIYTIPGTLQQRPAYERILRWLLSCHRSNTYHPLYIPDHDSFTSLALLCQAARFLNIPHLQEAILHRLDARIFPARELRQLLSNVSNLDDPAVAIAIKSLAGQYIVNPPLQEWILDFVRNERYVEAEEWFNMELTNYGAEIPEPVQVALPPSGTLRGGSALPPIEIVERSLEDTEPPDPESVAPSRQPSPLPPAPTPPPAVRPVPVVIHQPPRSPALSTLGLASDTSSRRPLLDGDRQVRRRWSGDGKELVRVKKKRTQGRRSGGSEEVIYMWLWRFAT
jgi:hypothetical protein